MNWQNFDSKIRRDHQKKNSYDRRDYESVDEKKSLSKAVSQKTMKKKNSGTKGLRKRV